MSITKPVLLDETFSSALSILNHEMKRQADYTEIMAAEAAQKIRTENLAELQHLIVNGGAEDILPIGDQLIVGYNWGNNEYDFEWDSVHIPEYVDLEDGEQHNGLILQSHWAHPLEVPFDPPEAAYAFINPVASGETVHFTVGTSTGDESDVGKSFQFTASVALLTGAQLMISMADNATLAGRTVTVYESAKATEPLMTTTLAVGSAGTDLGTFGSATRDPATGWNSTGPARYGYNRYRDSWYRQWLNNTGAGETWYEPTSMWDRPPANWKTVNGFETGFSQDFLSIIAPTKIQVATNTIIDGGVTDVMYDKFFLPSLQNMNISPQAADIEGPTWEYWQRALGRTTYWGTGSSNIHPALISRRLDAKTTACSVRLRSAVRGFTSYAWYVNSTGYANYNGYVSVAYRARPACVITSTNH